MLGLKKRFVNNTLSSAFLLLCVVFSATAKDVVDVQVNDQSLLLSTNDGSVTITALSDSAVSVWHQPKNLKQLPSFAVDPALDDKVAVSLSRTDSGWSFALPALTVKVNSSPLQLSYWQNGQLIAEEEVGLFHYETVRGFRFKLDENEQIMGGGQRVLGMDRRGLRMPLYNRAHYGYTTESNQMYYGLPAIMSSDKYAIIFDNSASGFLDIGHTDPDILQFEAVAGRTAYIFVAKPTFSELVNDVVNVTGKQPLPPRWALGNFASRFGYRNQQETLDTIDQFIQQDIAVDAVVLDLYWFGPDIKGHMGNLNWDRNNWPDPEGMIKTLRDKGVKTVVITEPFILTSSSQWQSAVDAHALAKNMAGEPRRFDFYFGNTGLVDVFDDAAQEWFWGYYESLASQGVEGWWGDLGEPEVHPSDSLHQLNGQTVTGDEIHNAYGHQWAKMVYERQRKLAPNKRPFVMMRAGFAGSQRYGMIPWTGDVSREWGGLQSQVELALQMGVFGLAYIHSDLGGFAGGESFDSELYTRWLQFGTFSPVFRPHAQEHIAPEPVFHAEPTKSLARDAINLRYQLTPYNYSLSYENSLTGAPIMRPLFMAFDDASIANTQSYLFGSAFLVTPVVEPGVKTVEIDLPSGVWFDYWTGEKLAGGEVVTRTTSIENIPLLVKAGSFIPMVDDLSNLEQYSTEKLTVHYYADASVDTAVYTMYDDDGVDPNSIANNNFQQLLFSAQQGDGLSLSTAVQGGFQGAPRSRKIDWVIHGLTQAPEAVRVNGEALTSAENLVWDPATNTLRVNAQLDTQLVIDIE